jgi:hypothetical protein
MLKEVDMHELRLWNLSMSNVRVREHVVDFLFVSSTIRVIGNDARECG